MLHFENLHSFFTHKLYLSKIFDAEDIFVVGGAIRDMLLGITDDPTDIDITMSGHPDQIWDQMNFDETTTSRFRTEKFGTMTIIPKTKNQTDFPLACPVTGCGVKGVKSGKADLGGLDKTYEYELTPLRTEGGYTDVRHPDDITRSNDLLLDSQRRDFTINCLYRYGADLDKELLLPTVKPASSADRGVKSGKADLGGLGKSLQSKNDILLPDSNTLILQDHDSIKMLFSGGKLQEDKLQEIIEKSISMNTNQLPPVKPASSADRGVKSGKADLGGLGNNENNYQLNILIDPHGGLLDLISGKLKTVGTPDDRFTEDALRIIRGVRFVNILNQKKNKQSDVPTVKGGAEGGGFAKSFDFEKKTWIAMQQHAQLVAQLSGERIHDELKKVFGAQNPFGYVSLLHELKLLPTIFPAVADTIGNEQPTRHHSLDTYHHTMMALKEGQRIFSEKSTKQTVLLPPDKGVKSGKADLGGLHEADELEKNSYYLPLLALLYHDVGKPEQYAKMGEAIAANPDDPDRSTYEYHTESGAKLAQQDLQKLCFSKKEIEEVMRYIRRHHRPGEILDGKTEKRPVRMRKLMSEGGYEWTKNLLQIVIADRLGQHNPLQSPQIDEIQQLDKLLDQLYQDEGRFTLAQLAISGDDLISELDITPGPELGELLSKAFDRVIADVSERNEKKKVLAFLSEK